MSRHYIHGINPTHTVVVGYDRPLNHFFAQVEVPGEPFPREITPVFGGVPTVDELREKVKPYADLQERVVTQLLRESRGLSESNRIVDHTTK